MPALHQRAGLFWCAFLPNAPRRYAVRFTLNQDPHHDPKGGRSSQLTSEHCAMQRWKPALHVPNIDATSRHKASLRQLNNHT